MTDHRPDGQEPNERLPGEVSLTRLYRAARSDAPPEALDRRILAEAKAAVTQDRRRAAHRMRWGAPVAAAAVLVLSVSLVLMLKDEGVMDRPDFAAPSLERAPEPQPEPVGPPVIAAEKAAKESAAPPSTREPAPASAPGDVGAGWTPGEERSRLPKRAPETVPGRWRIQTEPEDRVHHSIAAPEAVMADAVGADVIYVQATGNPQAYQFVVGIRTPATGCEQYVDWWEVLSEDGKLLYRRVLSHSHNDKQPFITTGGPVPIRPDAVVWLRAHMNDSGYGGRALRGSVQTGFQPAALPADFAAETAHQPPFPPACAY